MKQNPKLLTKNLVEVSSKLYKSSSSKDAPISWSGLNPLSHWSYANIRDQRKAMKYSQRFFSTPKPNLGDKSILSSNKFFKQLEVLSHEMKAHQAMNHPFFKYLEASSKLGFNKHQFALYLINFIFRTKTTAPVVASTLARAIYESD